MPTPRRYAILDVFADRPLAGNPLAVILDGAGIADDAMQAIAAEFNLSETVFVRPPQNSLHSADIRIFTPRRELPFAGHPTVGTAVILAIEASADGGPAEMVRVLEEKVGPVRCGVTVKDARAGHAVFDLPKLPEPSGEAIDRGTLAAALSIAPAEVGFENHRASAFSAGVPYVFVPVRDLAVAARASPDLALWQKALGAADVGVFVYCRETRGAGRHFHGRMFAPASGIPEDPATGSAVAAFAGVIAKFDQPPGGPHRYVIEQGFEMGRPSLIRLEVDMDDGRVVAARIGGDAVVVARGELTV